MNAQQSVVQQTITVNLGDRSYPILIGRGFLDGGFDLSRYVTGSDCTIVTNTTIAPTYLEALKDCLPGKELYSVEIPDGESHKTLSTVQLVLDRLVETGANRDTTVVALGGGVVGDIAGFAAACYLRGVAFIQVPTTLLAQVDSSVGGKTGVNHPGGKNFIGAFHQPKCVLIDTATLASLSTRELKAGLAEVIKYGAICDLEFLEWLEGNMDKLLAREPDALAYAIQRSCQLKAEVVAEDERESGRRAVLNFGHTFGHAIEHSLGYGEWLHGEAVAAGMVMAATLSDIGVDEVDRLKALIAAAGLPIDPPDIAARDWLDAMGMDKKVVQKKMRFVLLRALGTSYVSTNFNNDLLGKIIGTRGG